MAEENLVIILCWAFGEQNSTKIIMWDLGKNEKTTITHQKIAEQADLTRKYLTIFPSSGIVCLQEIGLKRTVGNNFFSQMIRPSPPQKFYFTYYNYANKNTLNKPICSASILIPPQKIDFCFRAIKVNQTSKMALISQYSHPEHLEMFMHEIDGNRIGCWKVHKLVTDFNINKGICTVGVNDLWQIEKGTMYIGIRTEFKACPASYSEKQLKQMVKYHSFIWDLNKITARSTKFTIEEPHKLQIVGMYNHKIFENADKMSPRKNLPTYYVDNEHQKILARRQNSYQLIDPYDDLEIRENQSHDPFKKMGWNLKSNRVLTLREKKIVVLPEISEISTFWLTNLIDNCEEDLLFMVNNLLTEEDLGYARSA